MRLWLDVEDLFEYVQTNYRRPSGVQRLAFESYRELHARYADTGMLCFVRHSFDGKGFRIVPWSEIVGLFTGLTTGDAPPASHSASEPTLPRLPGRHFVRKMAYRLPPSLRVQIVDTLATQGAALRSWGRLISALAHEVRGMPFKLWRRLNKPKAGKVHSPLAADCNFTDLAAAGDILLMLGSIWGHPDYAGLIRSQCKARGLRFGVLVYDLVPLRHPEWCDRLIVRNFRNWTDRVLPLCDVVFVISRATKSDVEAWAAERGIALPDAIVTLPIGSELRQAPGARGNRLPPPGSYALIVSTIEARKNHLLLFRVWRRLLKELPRDRVPTLVFAGRVGWLVNDLMQQIANSDHLGGKLVLVDSPSDADLAALYDGSLFTLFPSFYEGWGLPVTESLAFGKPCLIANRTSLPEAGGDLVRSFDPDNLQDAYAVIRNAIEDREGLARWEARIRREFKPVSWSATVDALVDGLGNPSMDASATLLAASERLVRSERSRS
jgi:glycosyltransferase involved in cell wall biosynthesis